MTPKSLIPIFYVADVDAAERYYIETLQFTRAFRYGTYDLRALARAFRAGPLHRCFSHAEGADHEVVSRVRGFAVRPAPRHGELAVNLAGSVSLFLISTWLARNEA